MNLSPLRSTLLIALAGCALAACSGTIAQTDSPPQPAAALTDGEFGYAMYDDLLQRHVDDQGMVDYAALKADREALDRFVASMAVVDLDTWPADAQMAFWINAYNAITLQYILDNYPIQKGGLVSGMLYPENSIRQIPGVWDKLETTVAGTPITLDAIEHEILRKEFSEPRIHMAIVCASIGCPPLRTESFVPERLEEQLDDQSRNFLSDSGRFRIDRQGNIVYLSPILKWFGKDFVPVYTPEDGAFSDHDETTAAVLNFVAQYVSESDAEYLRRGGYSVKFADYDWSLNEQ